MFLFDVFIGYDDFLVGNEGFLNGIGFGFWYSIIELSDEDIDYVCIEEEFFFGCFVVKVELVLMMV